MAEDNLNNPDSDAKHPGIHRLPTGRYAARIHKFKPIYLGSFDTEEEAIAAYNEAKAKDDPDDIKPKRQRQRGVIKTISEEIPKTNAKGYSRQWNGTFVARLSIDGKSRSVGTFKTEEEARHAYLKAREKKYQEKRELKLQKLEQKNRMLEMKKQARLLEKKSRLSDLKQQD